MASLQQQLISAPADGFFYLLFISVNISNVCFRVTGYPKEIAELTIGNTHVGGIDITINLPSDFAMWYLDLTKLIGYVHQLCKRSVFKQKHSFFHTQKFKRKGFTVKIIQVHNKGLNE